MSLKTTRRQCLQQKSKFDELLAFLFSRGRFNDFPRFSDSTIRMTKRLKSIWTPVFEEQEAYFQMEDGMKTLDEMTDEEIEEAAKWLTKIK